jgi:hypothetical protein
VDSKLFARGVAAAITVTMGLSGASLLTSGNATADWRTELLEEIGIAIGRGTHIPVVVATHQSTEVLGPVSRAAGNNEREFLRLKRGACDLNDYVGRGYQVADALNKYFGSYSDAERKAITDQQIQFGQYPSEFASILCQFNP